MLSNYLKIAYRDLQRHPGFSAINILGLAAGLCCFILIATYVAFEYSYDRFHEKGERIFRLSSFYSSEGETGEFAMTPTAAYPTFKREFPEVLSGVRIYSTTFFSPTVVAKGEEVFEERGFIWADSTFFELFTFPLVSGDASTVLDRVNTVVLTEDAAQRYFGAEDPVGKTLKVGGTRELVVTGVAANPPLNSQIKFDFVGSFHSLEGWREAIWDSANFLTYLELSTPTAAAPLADKIKASMPRLTGYPTTDRNYLTYVLQPMQDVHLEARTEGGLEPGGDIRYTYILSVIAVLILLIACINYVNLATARSVERAREAGVRKVVGAMQGQLFRQFFAESALVTAIALLLGFVAAYLLLPIFGKLTDRTLTFPFFENPIALVSLVGLGAVVSLLSGAYPALVMSNFQPIQVLKGSFSTTGRGGSLRRGLVVFQFAVSFLLMVGTVVISRQLSFIQNQKLGYNKDQVLELPIDQTIRKNAVSFKQSLKADPSIKDIALATENPVFIQGGYSIWVEGRPEEFNMTVGAIGADEDYIKTLGMELVAGEDFTASDVALVAMDSAALRQYHFILNETAVKNLGWTPESAVGKRARINGRAGKIKGVVRDFHFASMRDEIQPFAMFVSAKELNKIIIKLNTTNLSATLEGLRRAWKARAPHRPFEYEFLDEQFAQLYRTEQRSGRAAAIFAILAVLIACLGLFGLATFMATKRMKEIGVRKVLGASIPSIVGLLATDFLKWVLLAIAIAAPFAYYIAQQWLSNFAYHVPLQWWMFAVAAAAAVGIAFLTVSYQSVKAALSNPVASLRSE